MKSPILPFLLVAMLAVGTTACGDDVTAGPDANGTTDTGETTDTAGTDDTTDDDTGGASDTGEGDTSGDDTTEDEPDVGDVDDSGDTEPPEGDTDEDADADDADEDADADDADEDAEADTDTDTGVELDPDEVACGSPNPAKNCNTTGCPDGEICTPEYEGHCIPSSCGCDEDTGIWICTEDCGPKWECEPEPACPDVPDYGGDCENEGQYCAWGQETCCGETHDSLFCQCDGGSWLCISSDACMSGTCEGRPCDDDSQCESFGNQLECVLGTCTQTPASQGWYPEGELVLRDDCEGYGVPFAEIGELSIDGDMLIIPYTTNFSCEATYFRLCWAGAYAGSDPYRVDIDVTVETMCAADPVERILSTNLNQLREAYRGDSGTLTLVVGDKSIEFSLAD